MIDINRCLKLAGNRIDIHISGEPGDYAILGPHEEPIAQGSQQQMIAALRLILSPHPDNYSPPTYGD